MTPVPADEGIDGSAKRPHPGRERRGRGFTLIELLIVVAIVAILATFAYPGYQEQLRKTRRADATANLLELVQFMERNFSVTGRYNQDAGGNAIAVPPWTEAPQDAGTKYYDLSFQAITASTFTLQAAPKNAQAGDTLCGTLRIDQAGTKTETGTGTPADCW